MSRHRHEAFFDPTCGDCVQQAATDVFEYAAGSPQVPVEDQAVIDGALPEVVRVAGAIGRALSERGVKITTDAAIAAAYRVVEEQGTAVRVTESAGTVRVPVEDQALIDGAPPEVSQVANAIGWALAKRGVKFTADDAIAAAYRVVDQSPAVRVTESAGTVEAHINGSMSFDDVRTAVETALRARIAAESGNAYCWAYATDLTDTDVVYAVEGDLYQCSYVIDATGQVTLGDPTEVVRTYMPAPAGEPEDEPGGEGQAPEDVVAAEAGGMSWSSDKHPRAKKGDPNGGQFAPLSYNSATKTGSGYGKKAGDPNVKALQRELNRLGATDKSGAKLKVDGKLGPLTTSATIKVQKALGIKPANGKVTPELLARLRKAKTVKGLGSKPGPQPGKRPGPQAPKSNPKAKKVVKAPLKEAEERDQLVGRILEAKGENDDGGRIFGVRIIAYGDSKNRRRYPEAVMREAAPLYEGAKAYDHHRTDEELKTSTINGLIGSYRDVVPAAEGIEADLHLLPGATHAAESLDASIAAQEAGLQPLIGLSHDVMARFKSVTEGGQQVQEATAITQVNSADLVADPAAGGMATRMVAGGTDGTGTEPAESEEGDVPTKEEILAAFAEASDDELQAVGLSRTVEAGAETTETTEAANTEAERQTEASVAKGSFLAGLMIRDKVNAAGLPEAVAEGVTAALPERIVEADVDAQIAGIKASLGLVERAGLTPTVGSAKVTQEARDKKIAALDAFFAGKFTEGYRSFRQAWEDWTGHRPQAWDVDVNKLILRESYGGYDSGDRMRVEEGEVRLRESMDSTTWNLVLGDSITRRLIAEYSRPSLAVWRQIVSSIVPLNDFRTQRIDRIGGYGILPDVGQGAPYQDLTSPGNQEINYALGKKGGIESITFEMIANDDVRAISKIPVKLGMAAAQTLYRFIFDIFVTNAAVTYDGVTLFHASHANTGTSALGQTSLSAVRAAMRQQAGYGDNKDILSIVPQTLIVPSSLEELAWQLATSAVALPSSAPTGGASDTPNIHHRMSEPIVVDYYSDQNDWYTVADPSQVPTIEVGFYNGREDPELFTQSDPSVGSVFDADKITYKIRHMYSAAVLDHRGFYRNTL